MKPRFKHDCPACLFLGRHYGYDVYLCDDSILARSGNEPHRYASKFLSVLQRGLNSNFRSWDIATGKIVYGPMRYEKAMLAGLRGMSGL
jgi:hypothetical protein